MLELYFFELISEKHLSKIRPFYKGIMEDDVKCYLFFDEIQNISNWEKEVNSFKSEYKESVSIFITGPNSDLLSRELAIYLAGRYVSFKVFPFKEVCKLKENENKDIYELEREFHRFDNIGDHYLKYVILTDKFDISQNSIIHMNIIDSLLNNEYKLLKKKKIEKLMVLCLKRECY